MPHQTRAWRYCQETRNPALFMEMRTGKTLTAIRWAKWLRRFGCVLVLAPVTVLEAWEGELFLEGERFSTCYGVTAKERQEAIARAWFKGETGRHWLLMNYEGVLTLGEVLQRGRRRVRQVPGMAFLPWLAVILDESTRVKNPQAQITNVCVKGFRQARHRAILTGLPNPEGDLDLVCQFLFLEGQFMGYRSYWAARAALFQKRGFDWVPKPGTRAAIKRYVHERAFVLTAAQAGMRSRTVYQTRHVDMTPAQRRLYREVVEDYAATLATGETKETEWVLTQRTWLQHITGGFDPDRNLISSRIADDLIELLRGELRGKKFVVWFKYRHELLYFKERLKKAGISCVSILGGEPLTLRKSKLAQFRDWARGLLATERVAKFGIDCSVADVAVYYSNEWSNEDRSQSEKRIVHPKQERTNLVIDYVIRGTISEDVVSAVKDKSINSKLFMSKLEERFRRRLKDEVKRSQTMRQLRRQVEGAALRRQGVSCVRQSKSLQPSCRTDPVLRRRKLVAARGSVRV
jgi:hypothetical protein